MSTYRFTDGRIESHGKAIPYVSRVDSGIMELVARTTGAEIESSADLYVDAGMQPLRCGVAVNANAADPHYFPSRDLHSPIREGDVVLIDLWNREEGDPEFSIEPGICLPDFDFDGSVTAYRFRNP